MNPIPVWGDGTELRDLLYIEDFVEALQVVMENETEMFEIYNVGSNEVHSVNDVLELMKESVGHSAPIEYINGKPSMIPTRRINSDKIRTKLGWEPKVSLKDGLMKAYKWYLENKEEFR
jgi:GDP-L-fucose synthase